MHNSLQNDIILTLSVFAVIWFLLTYIFHRINKNDEPGDISGVMNRAELRYNAKFRQTIRALIVSFMYDDYVLTTVNNLKTDEPVRAFLVKENDVKLVEMQTIRYMVATNVIRIAAVNSKDTIVTITYKPTTFAFVWCAYVLIRYRSIMKTIDTNYLYYI